MEPRRVWMRLFILVLYLTIAATTLFTQCDASSKQLHKFGGPIHLSKIIKPSKKLKVLKHLDMDRTLDSSNIKSYGVNSPFSLPPFDSLAPIPLPENTPPFCEYPPFTPQAPSTTTIPTPTAYTQPPPLPPPSYFTPIFPIQSPPPSPIGIVVPSPAEYSASPNPPEIVPSPPIIIPGPPQYIPSPFIYVPSPPEFVPSPFTYGPSPPSYVPSPPEYVPSPSGFAPSHPVFQPPVVHPPPSVPPPPYSGSVLARWCVAKPSVPDPIILEAMNYACGSGADCNTIQPEGTCFHPDTVFAHASYAFNSYWQRTKVAGGTCDFGGTAMLVTIDPSFDGCHFLNF